MEELDSIANFIHEIPDAVVKLNGYTDSAGDPDFNFMISELRASAIKLYLVGKGIPSENIEVNGYGATDFIATNRTAGGATAIGGLKFLFTAARRIETGFALEHLPESECARDCLYRTGNTAVTRVYENLPYRPWTGRREGCGFPVAGALPTSAMATGG